MLGKRQCCVRRAGDYRFRNVKEITLKEYQRSLRIFVNWLVDNALSPHDPKESLLGKVALQKLGSIVHTKARREQVAFIYEAEDPNAFKLLQWLADCTSPGTKLFNFSYSSYNKFIERCCIHFGLKVRFSGHSARAGFIQ